MTTVARESAVAELATSTWVHAGSAVLVMGSWAAFANRSHGVAAALTAACVQGAASAVFTSTMKLALEACAVRLAGAAALVVPPLLVASVVLALLVGAHSVAHTPEIAATIAIPYAASFSYAWVYAALLARRRSREDAATGAEDAPRASAGRSRAE